jgi:uncharacterized protein YprB with RNaseH-like and TPR domain
MSSALAERLRVLRREVGVAASADPSPRPSPARGEGAEPLSPSPLAGEGLGRGAALRQEVPDHIRRLLGLRTRSASPRSAVRSYAPEDEFLPDALPLPSRERAGERGPHSPYSRTFSLADRHLPGDEIAPGLRYLESRHDAPTLPPQLDASFAKNFDTVARDHLLFFDTETTGLAGGTGTRAFMIGASDLVDGQLRIRQLLTTTMAAEDAMLRIFAGWLSPQTVLVSYNGRSYDAPLLKTRYRLARLPCPITPLAHLDLLHPVRRRYRGQWENCRLGTVERRLLRVLRDDDLPGSEAPRAWRDYLLGGPATDLRRVLAHNHTDVRSLAQLLGVLCGVNDGDGAGAGLS